MIPVGNKFSIKKQPSEVLLKISQSSQKNTCACAPFKNILFTEYLWVTVSEYRAFISIGHGRTTKLNYVNRCKNSIDDWQSSLRKKCLYSELFWLVFSRILTDYWEIRSISWYSIWIRENTDQNTRSATFSNFLNFLIRFCEPCLMPFSYQRPKIFLYFFAFVYIPG